MNINQDFKQFGIWLSEHPEAVETYKNRSKFIYNIRTYMHSIDAFELEMPCLQKHREGAPVHQFVTIHPLTGERFYLRHCMEDHLKRICNSFGQVYELGKAFRAEVVNDFKSNEFTVLEYVGLEVEYQKGIDLVINLFKTVITNTFGSLVISDLNFNDISTITFNDLMLNVLEFNMFDSDFRNKSFLKLKEKEVPYKEEFADWEIYEELLKHYLEPSLYKPSIITDYPIALQHVSEIDDIKQTAKRFSFVVKGIEVCDGGVKFPNSTKYRSVYDSNAEYRAKYFEIQDNESPEEYYRDIDFYSKNVFTFGFGVDRLFAICNSKTIRETVLFPFH